CTEAIRLNPQNAWAYSNRGNACSKRGDRERANADYAKARELTTRTSAYGPSGAPAESEFVSPEGGFAVRLPGTPRRAPPITARTDVGSVPVTLFLLDRGDVAYSVDYADLPPGAVNQLGAMIDRAVAAYQGTGLK